MSSVFIQNPNKNSPPIRIDGILTNTDQYEDADTNPHYTNINFDDIFGWDPWDPYTSGEFDVEFLYLKQDLVFFEKPSTNNAPPKLFRVSEYSIDDQNKEDHNIGTNLLTMPSNPNLQFPIFYSAPVVANNYTPEDPNNSGILMIPILNRTNNPTISALLYIRNITNYNDSSPYLHLDMDAENCFGLSDYTAFKYYLFARGKYHDIVGDHQDHIMVADERLLSFILNMITSAAKYHCELYQSNPVFKWHNLYITFHRMNDKIYPAIIIIPPDGQHMDLENSDKILLDQSYMSTF